MEGYYPSSLDGLRAMFGDCAKAKRSTAPSPGACLCDRRREVAKLGRAEFETNYSSYGWTQSSDDGLDWDMGEAVRDLCAACAAIRAMFAAVLDTLLAIAAGVDKPCHLAGFRKAAIAIAGKLHGLLHVCLTAARLTTAAGVAPIRV